MNSSKLSMHQAANDLNNTKQEEMKEIVEEQKDNR